MEISSRERFPAGSADGGGRITPVPESGTGQTPSLCRKGCGGGALGNTDSTCLVGAPPAVSKPQPFGAEPIQSGFNCRANRSSKPDLPTALETRPAKWSQCRLYSRLFTSSMCLVCQNDALLAQPAASVQTSEKWASRAAVRTPFDTHRSTPDPRISGCIRCSKPDASVSKDCPVDRAGSGNQQFFRDGDFTRRIPRRPGLEPTPRTRGHFPRVGCGSWCFWAGCQL